MCGIAGILRVTPVSAGPEALRHALARPHEDAIPESWLDTLDESIKHRGPDGQGRFRDRAVRHDGAVVDVAFVHRRLSILDHAGGAQPMTADGVTAVFNGCIYNHRELRRELIGLGQRFASDHSDTEVLVRGWKAWDHTLPDRLNGMYGVMLWDKAQATLALFRDPMGEKPLYAWHALRDGSWVNAFSSVPPEVTALPALVGASEVLIEAGSAPAHWLRLGYDYFNPLPGARALQPGLLVRYGAEKIEADSPVTSYFGPLTNRGSLGAAFGDRAVLEEEVHFALSEAVHRRLDADVPLGCFLSGGVDSSLIAHFARRQLGTLKTFTVRMPDHRYDESVYADTVARHLATDHATLDCDARPADDLVALVRQIGMPFGDSSLLPAYWLCRAARREVKVALSGDGGDELFLGYDRYRAVERLHRWRPPGAAVVARLVGRGAHPTSARSRVARLFDAMGHAGYLDLVSIFPTSDLHALLVGTRGVEDDKPFADSRDYWSLGSAVWFDLTRYLPDDLMRKTDAASMCNALEVRAPFLDPELVRLCTTATHESLMPRGERKGLLRQVARRYLPAEIVDRPKQGFAIPIGEWFRTDFGGMKTLLLDHLNSVEPFGPPRLGIDLNRRFIQQMVDEHMESRRDHGQRLYMLLVMSIWARWVGAMPQAAGDGRQRGGVTG